MKRWVWALAALGLAGCTGLFPPIVGGPCTYEDTAGTATIVSVNPAPADVANCGSNAVEIVFDFAPTDTTLTDRVDTGEPFTLSGGLNPDADWAASAGLTVGATFAALRQDIVTGTCTPILYEFTDIDYETALEACQ